jgi:O-antigen/teichoic acid export membrane protein
MGILGQIVSFLPFGTILTSLLPQYIDKANERLQLLRSSIKAQLLLSIALLSIAVVCAPFLFLLFPQYLPARTLVYVTLLAVVPAAVVGVYTPWFMTLKEQRTFFTSMLWKTLFLVLAIGGGSAMGGVVGIGVGVALGFLASMVERTLRLKRLIPDFSFPNPFSWDSAERQFFVRGMTGVRSLFSRFFV